MKGIRTALLTMTIALLAAPGQAVGAEPIEGGPPFGGTYYVVFEVAGTPLTLPAMITFHRDGSFTGVDGGDFGALGALDPMRLVTETTQHGVWRRAGARTVEAVGMILSFHTEAPLGNLGGLEGELSFISRTRITLELGDDVDSFDGTAFQDIWLCPTTFSCPDPFAAEPDMVVPPGDVSLHGRRVRMD